MIDRWLLAYSPNFWCLRFHYVIPGSIVACMIFGWTGESLAHSMEANKFEVASAIAILLCGAVGLYWCYLQARQRYSRFQRSVPGFRIFLAYPLLIALILLPASVFDTAAYLGRDGRRYYTVTGDDESFMVITGIAAIAMVCTWIFRSLTIRAIVIGAVGAICFTAALTIIFDAMFSRDTDIQQGLFVAYIVFAFAAMLVLVFRKWVWPTAASMLTAPAIGGMGAEMSGFASGSDWGFEAAFFVVVAGVVICMLFQPLLNRYRTLPK